MRIERFNENAKGDQLKEWVEDLLVPLIDIGFNHSIIKRWDGFIIRFWISVQNFDNNNSNYSILDRVGEFYGELNNILTTFRKQFDVWMSFSDVPTNTHGVEIMLLKKNTIHLPEFMELDGNTIWVDKVLLKANIEIPIWGCQLDGEWRLEIELKNDFDEEYMKNYFRSYNIFDCDVYGRRTFVVDLKGRKYNFRMK